MPPVGTGGALGCPALIHGDCFEAMAGLPAASVHALISDPPYGRTRLPWDRGVDWPRFWEEAHRVCAAGAAIVLFSAQPFTTDLINSNRREFRYELIWHKNRAVGWLDARRRPLRAHENILVFTADFARHTYNPQMEDGHAPYRRPSSHRPPVASHYNWSRRSAGGVVRSRYPRSVLSFASRQEAALHPTQKPLKLMDWLVRTYSQPGDVVLDPFMGSGTTGAACLQSGRGFIGIESDKGYFEKASHRLQGTVLPHE